MPDPSRMSPGRRKAIARQNAGPTPEQRAGQLSTSLTSAGGATRAEGTQGVRDFNPEDYLGADALSAIFERATATNFRPQMASLQARNARRGIRGPLAGATEGDLAGAFHRNLMGTVADFGAQRGQMAFGRARELAEIGGTDRAQGISLLGTELELQLAREQAKKEERQGKRRFFGSLIGGVGGFLAGGPPGAVAGASIGGSI